MLACNKRLTLVSRGIRSAIILVCTSTLTSSAIKEGFHIRNKHRNGYDFRRCTDVEPTLSQHLTINKYGTETIDFSNPSAVQCLNGALLKAYYDIDYWQIPPSYLCPSIPSRADYVHRISDLLGSTDANNDSICGLDIGVGASCVYPIIGSAEYDWKFVGIDIDAAAQMSSQAIIDKNARLKSCVELRLQENPFCIFHGALKDTDKFAFCMTNPPFHANLGDAEAATTRKWRNLGKKLPDQRPVLNFGGVESELCCPGGEVGFLARMIEESAEPFVRERIGLFTALVSSQDSLPVLLRLLRELPTKSKVHVVEMKHGQKKSRILAWRHQK